MRHMSSHVKQAALFYRFIARQNRNVAGAERRSCPRPRHAFSSRPLFV